MKKDQICITCGKVFHSAFIMNQCQFCNPNVVGIPNFIIKDNIEYILNKQKKEYIKKDQYFKEYEKYIKNLNINDEIQKFIDIGFNLEPIIDFDPVLETWSRSKTDKYLSDKGYNWIVYIKLFKKIPFIMGKTGTKNIIQSGIDFDFRIFNPNNKNDSRYQGVGRKFLKEFYPEEKYTDYNQILVKNFNNEIDSLEYEEFISNNYLLFNS